MVELTPDHLEVQDLEFGTVPAQMAFGAAGLALGEQAKVLSKMRIPHDVPWRVRAPRAMATFAVDSRLSSVGIGRMAGQAEAVLSVRLFQALPTFRV